jgi:hypothetical protein
MKWNAPQDFRIWYIAESSPLEGSASTHNKQIDECMKVGDERLLEGSEHIHALQNQAKLQTRTRRCSPHHKWDKNWHNYITGTKYQTSSPFTHSEGLTRPSLRKRGYMISHSDLSKSTAEKTPHGVGAARARPTSIFMFLDFLCGSPTAVGFCRWGFRDEVTHEQDRRVDGMSAWDSWSTCGALTGEVRNLRTSMVKAT